MKKGFERTIRDYNEIAKDFVEGGLSQEEEADLESELASRVRRATRDRDSDHETQWRVYDVQGKKQEIMQKLKERIALLDDPEHVREKRDDERLAIGTEGGFLVRSRDGREVIATKGEIMTDMDWGVYYHLDPATVDRNTRKRYLIEDAKQELQRLLDEQITVDALGSAQTDSMKREAYAGRAESTGKETGFLAEKMTKGYLKQLSFDLDVDFDVLESDAQQDVERKIDFIVKRKRHERGVEVEEDTKESVERVGVQFTTNMSEEAHEHKQYQVDREKQMLRTADPKIKDLVLVQIPPRQVREAFYAWKDDPIPGGPQKYWDDEVKEGVFRGVMDEVLTRDEIDDQWAIVQGHESRESEENKDESGE